MKHRFFKIPADGGDREDELNQFAASHRVLAVERQFVANGSDSFWALAVRYLDGAETPALLRKGKVDYRDVLNEAEFAVFAELRALRKTLSEREGLPPYALFTNEQLAAMVRQRVRSKQDMGAIDGIGAARLEKYGAQFLEVLLASASPAAEDPAP